MNKKNTLKLYLIPVPLGENTAHVIPPYIADIIRSLDTFIVEHAKSARHAIKAIAPGIVLQNLNLVELNEHEKAAAEAAFLTAIKAGKSVGLLSDAGCPGIADPGATIVALAHKNKIEVVPLVGPSSILLALMASGMNGQSFTFHGYLGAKTPDLSKDLKNLEQFAQKNKQTQLFIETPYRNKNVFDLALQQLQAQTRLGIAMDLTLESQYIFVTTIQEWKKTKVPDLHKRPAVFMIM
jgi:16S rRNA (cytidine1402-2'-O)-methyltransferase